MEKRFVSIYSFEPRRKIFDLSVILLLQNRVNKVEPFHIHNCLTIDNPKDRDWKRLMFYARHPRYGQLQTLRAHLHKNS